MKKYITGKYSLIIMLVYSMLLISCKKFLSLQPISNPTEDNFYSDAKGLNGALIGVYNGLQATSLYGANLLHFEEVRADNMDNNNPGGGGGVSYQIEAFNETPANTMLRDTWLGFYNTILNANIVIERSETIAMDEAAKKQIVGQAMFLRGLCYFHLVRLWGKVPLIITPQTTAEARANTRADSAAIYAQIISDLNNAATSLPASWPDVQKGRATSYAARALLAKVYLWQKRYPDVQTTLNPVVDAINVKSVISLVPQTSTFPGNLKTSKDVLFAVQYLSGGVGESVHQNNRYRNQDNGFVIMLPQTLFESGDNRKALVAPTGNGARPGKFNVPASNNETSADFPVIRCAEVMLMYAEVLNEQSITPTTEAFAALNAVRSNAGTATLSTSTTPTKEAFRNAVFKERRLELALECDRWFDIIRTGQAPSIYPLVPSTRYIYPVPQSEIDNLNDKTGWQNPGY